MKKRILILAAGLALLLAVGVFFGLRVHHQRADRAERPWQVPSAELMDLAIITPEETIGMQWSSIRITDPTALKELVRLLNKTSDTTLDLEIARQGAEQHLTIALRLPEGADRRYEVFVPVSSDQFYIRDELFDDYTFYLLKDRYAKRLKKLLDEQPELDITDPQQITAVQVTLPGQQEQTFSLPPEQFATLSDALGALQEVSLYGTGIRPRNAVVQLYVQYQNEGELYLTLDPLGNVRILQQSVWQLSVDPDLKSSQNGWVPLRLAEDAQTLLHELLQQTHIGAEQWEPLTGVTLLASDATDDAYASEMRVDLPCYPVRDPEVIEQFLNLANEGICYGLPELEYGDFGVGVGLHNEDGNFCNLSIQRYATHYGERYFLHRWDQDEAHSIWALDAEKAEQLLALIAEQPNITQLEPGQIKALVAAAPGMDAVLATAPMDECEYELVWSLKRRSPDTVSYLDVEGMPYYAFSEEALQAVCDALADAQDATQTNFAEYDRMLLTLLLQLEEDVQLQLSVFGNLQKAWVNVIHRSPLVQTPITRGSSNSFELRDPGAFLDLLEDCRRMAAVRIPVEGPPVPPVVIPQPEPEPEPEFDFTALDFTRVERIEFLYPLEDGTGTKGVNVEASLAGEIGALVTAALEQSTAPVSFADPDSSMVLYFPDGGQLALIYQPAEDGYHLTLAWHAPGAQSARAYGYFIPGEDPFAELFAEWAP